MNGDIAIFLAGTCMQCSEVVVLHGIASAHTVRNRQIACQDLTSIERLFGIVGKNDIIGTEIMVGNCGQFVFNERRKRGAVEARYGTRDNYAYLC